MTESVKIKTLKCPKCRKRQVRLLSEHYATSYEFEVEGNQRQVNGTGLESADITHVSAQCECGNIWRLRGITQVTDLDVRQLIE